MYFNVNFNVFFKLIKVHLLVSELYVKLHTFYWDQENDVWILAAGKDNLSTSTVLKIRTLVTM